MLYANFENNVVGIELKASRESCRSQSSIISEILFLCGFPVPCSWLFRFWGQMALRRNTLLIIRGGLLTGISYTTEAESLGACGPHTYSPSFLLPSGMESQSTWGHGLVEKENSESITGAGLGYLLSVRLGGVTERQHPLWKTSTVPAPLQVASPSLARDGFPIHPVFPVSTGTFQPLCVC